MTRAPRRSTASSFAFGAWSGTTTVHGMPRRRAFQATPCAMLPAEAVVTPRASAAGSASATALPAPRSLKEPMGWSASTFSQISAGPSTGRRRSGVRTTNPETRCRAATISSRETGARGSIGVGTVASELEESADARGAGLSVDVLRGSDVLDRETDRLEQRDLVGVASPLDGAEQDLAELARDVRVRHRPLAAREEEVAGLRQRRLPAVDEEA